MAKVILPSKFLLDEERFLNAVETALDLAVEGVITDFQVTTRTWKEKPVFEVEKKSQSRYIFTSNRIYGFVSGGTRVRYATMTKNFRAKSRVGWIGSRVGKGGVAFISRKHPRPGIVARQFEKAVGKKWKKKLPELLAGALSMESNRKV